MRRREFITILGGATASPLSALAQARPKMLRVGTTSTAPLSGPGSIFEIFLQRMRELGYVEGQNFKFDYIDLHGRADRYPEGMRELARRGVDILLVFGPEVALQAALSASATIPIVLIAIDFNPLARGYAKSLSKPGGNITGVSFQQIELAVKRVQLIRDALPEIRAATVFWDELSADQWKATRDAAVKFGPRVAAVKLANPPYDYERAIGQVPPENRKLLIPMTSPLFARDRKRLAQFAQLHRMASIFVFREYVDLGGLMSFGPNRSVMTRRAADYVNRIARGARPADLPIEQPATFELVINSETAKRLGIDLSPAILLRADEVIE